VHGVDDQRARRLPAVGCRGKVDFARIQLDEAQAGAIVDVEEVAVFSHSCEPSASASSRIVPTGVCSAACRPATQLRASRRQNMAPPSPLVRHSSSKPLTALRRGPASSSAWRAGSPGKWRNSALTASTLRQAARWAGDAACQRSHACRSAGATSSPRSTANHSAASCRMA
jgi:hypothetical protein